MYRIKVEGQGDAGVPDIDLGFGRVTVILGANGAGKSRLLGWLKNNSRQFFGGPRPVTYIEGGRVAHIPANLNLDHTEINPHRTAASSLQHHKNKRIQLLTSRIKDALVTLFNKEQEEKAAHSDKTSEWIENGQKGPVPRRDEPPLDRLGRLFHNALPLLTFQFESPNLFIKKGTRRYGADSMSDGERQALALLADVGMLAEKNSLIVVDEPELNMSALLASSLWSTIESEYPEAIFVYGTHSIPFSIRDSVNKVVVLSATGPAAEIVDPTEMDENELRPFLGAMPNILRGERVLLVEGMKDSFDSDFYKWITKGKSIEVVPVGDCYSVEAASKQDGIWSKTPQGPTIRGLIDRDYRSDDVVRLRSDKCDVLELHEAESYLCDPKLLHSLAAKLRIVDPIPSEEAFSEKILSFSKTRIIQTAAKRAFERLRMRLGPSIANSAIDKITDEARLIELLRKDAKAETDRATQLLSEAAVEVVFKQEMQRCREAVDTLNLREMLKLFPGKELLKELEGILGLSSSQSLITAVRGHLLAGSFEFTKELQTSFPQGWL